MKVQQADVVVLGGGAAGLSAALAAAESGATVAVVSKVYPMRSHTVAAEGGAAGVHRSSDSVQLHAEDTFRAGAGLAEPAAVEYVVNQAPVELARLERLGMPFSRLDDGDVATRPFGGMSQPRTWFAADKTGFHLLHTLFQTALSCENIKFFNEYFALDLFLSPGQQGLLTCSQADGVPVLFVAPALIIATGGYARAWGTSTNAAIVTGDGQALALRAGLPLRDMEFVQWHPTCLPGTGFLITEAARGEGGVLLDKDGKRYLADYGLGPETPVGQPQPRQMELGPRDALSGAFASAVADGRTRQLTWIDLTRQPSSDDNHPSSAELSPSKSPGTPEPDQSRRSSSDDTQSRRSSSDGSRVSRPRDTQPITRQIDVVDLDLTHLGPRVLAERLPLVLDLARRYARVDATKQPIPICPAAHYTMGGIPTDTSGQVLNAESQPVPGLFAAGECAATGLHGANRLGSNSLVETLVMGRAAGLAAASISTITLHDAAAPSSTTTPPDGAAAKSATAAASSPESTKQAPDQNARNPESEFLDLAQARWDSWLALRGNGSENHYQLQAELGELLNQNFGIRVNTAGLTAAAEKIAELQQRYQSVAVSDTCDQYNTDWQQAIELGYLLDCAQATVAAALARQESRGAFHNTDFPTPDTNPKHSLVWFIDSEWTVQHRPVGQTGGAA